jgi:ComF family protein
VLDLLLPQRCLACSRPGAQVCARCRAALRIVTPPWCGRCGAPTAWPVRRCRECAGRRISFADARSAVVYDEPVRRIVAGWKERGLRGLADWAAAVTATAVARPARDGAVVAAVPPDRDRRLRRGHHAADGLAARLAERWELPCEPLLVRARAAPRQRGLMLAERRRNVRGAFDARAAPAHVVLVDDVYTTGATANAAASALRRAGARKVHVVTFARAIRMR